MAVKTNDYVHFTDLHDKMVQVTTGLITKTGFKEWLNATIDVKPYLSIVSKYAIINVFASTFKNKAFNQGDNKKIDLDLVYLEYDISMVFDLMFYYTNIIALPSDKTTKNYDLVKQSGLYNFINSKCNDDYSETLEKCDRLTGIHNVSMMNEILNALGTYPSTEDIETMKNTINEIDGTKLSLLKEIEVYNNPTLKKLVDIVNEEATKEEMGKIEK